MSESLGFGLISGLKLGLGTSMPSMTSKDPVEDEEVEEGIHSRSAMFWVLGFTYEHVCCLGYCFMFEILSSDWKDR